MIAMLLYAVILGGLGILLVAGASAFRDAIRQRARPLGFLMALAVMALALVGFWVMLI